MEDAQALGYTNQDDVDSPVNVTGSDPYQNLGNDHEVLAEREKAYLKKKAKFDAKTWLDRGHDERGHKQAGKNSLADKERQAGELADELAAINKEKNRILTQMGIVLRNWPVIEGQVLNAIQFTFNNITDLQARLDAPKKEYESRYPNKREIWRRQGGVQDAQDQMRQGGSALRRDIAELSNISQNINGLGDGELADAPKLIQQAESLINRLRVSISEYLALGTEEYYTEDELGELADMKNATLGNYHDTQGNYMETISAYLQRLTNSGEYDDFDMGTFYWDKEIERMKGRTKETDTLLNLKDAGIPWELADTNAGGVLKNYYATFDTVPLSVSVSQYQLPPDNACAGYTIQRTLFRMSDGSVKDQDGNDV